MKIYIALLQHQALYSILLYNIYYYIASYQSLYPSSICRTSLATAIKCSLVYIAFVYCTEHGLCFVQCYVNMLNYEIMNHRGQSVWIGETVLTLPYVNIWSSCIQWMIQYNQPFMVTQCANHISGIYDQMTIIVFEICMILWV